MSSWSLLHHLIHCFINQIHYNTFYTSTSVSSQLYFPLRFSGQNSVCVCRIPLTWNTSFPPEPSSFHQPSNISSSLIIKEHLAVCTHGGVLGNVEGDLTDIQCVRSPSIFPRTASLQKHTYHCSSYECNRNLMMYIPFIPPPILLSFQSSLTRNVIY